MGSIDTFYDKEYHIVNYNCLHFVVEVWKFITGEDIKEKLGSLIFAHSDRAPDKALTRQFRRLDAPAEPCIVLMSRPRLPPHVGIYIGGKVFHIHPRGVELQPINVAMRGYFTARFYTCKP